MLSVTGRGWVRHPTAPQATAGTGHVADCRDNPARREHPAFSETAGKPGVPQLARPASLTAISSATVNSGVAPSHTHPVRVVRDAATGTRGLMDEADVAMNRSVVRRPRRESFRSGYRFASTALATGCGEHADRRRGDRVGFLPCRRLLGTASPRSFARSPRWLISGPSGAVSSAADPAAWIDQPRADCVHVGARLGQVGDRGHRGRDVETGGGVYSQSGEQ